MTYRTNDSGWIPTLAAVMLSAAFVVQGVILIGAWRGHILGFAGSLVAGIAWLLAAGIDHAGDLVDESFREGFTSDALIVGTMVSATLLLVSSAAAMRTLRPGTPSDGEGTSSNGAQRTPRRL
jgi:hypothetical protein